MSRPQVDDVARRPDVPHMRVLVVAGGFLLAAGATLAVFLTDNPQYLRIAVVAVAWAFVLAAFAAGRRGGDRATAAAREGELRRAYEHELDLEVAARREYELALENQVRGESEHAMRAELDALRGELAALADLRDSIAAVAAMRADVAGISALREEVARVAAMREDIVALGSLRQELGQLHELRDDMGRLRVELTEQLSSELLVERIVMRTQAGRFPGDPARLDGPARTLDAPSWGEEPPRGLTGGWPAIQLDEPRETRQVERVRVERADVRPAPPQPSTTMFAGPQPARLGPPPSSTVASAPRAAVPAVPAGPATTAFPLLPPSAPVESALPVEPVPVPVPVPVPQASPLDWLAARSLLDSPDAPDAPDAPVVLRDPDAPRVLSTQAPTPPRPSPRRRRNDEPASFPVPEADARTAERPSPPAAQRTRIEDRGGYRVALPDPPDLPAPHSPPAQPADPATSPGSSKQLAEILAENGGDREGRRRRRYREDGEADEVLSRVLGRD